MALPSMIVAVIRTNSYRFSGRCQVSPPYRRAVRRRSMRVAAATARSRPRRCSRVLAQREPLPFALTGSWAGGGAIVGCGAARASPPTTTTRSRVLDALPPSTPRRPTRVRSAAAGSAGSATGWRRASSASPHARRGPSPLPDSHLAYYDNVLRHDARRASGGSRRSSPTAGATRSSAPALPARDLAAPPRAARRAAPAPSRGCISSARAPSTTSPRSRECRRADRRRRDLPGQPLPAPGRRDCDGAPPTSSPRALAHVDPPYGGRLRHPARRDRQPVPRAVPAPPRPRRRHRPDQGHDRRATPTPIVAAAARDALRGSAKDAAEHVMIVDLMRNDLGRVCEYGTVDRAAPTRPPSRTRGLAPRLARPRPAAPEVTATRDAAARDVPARLGHRRAEGPGAAASSPSSSRPAARSTPARSASPARVAGLELNVAIRTLRGCADGRLWLGAGGGIVADSDPRAELEEALAKARPIAAAVGTTVDVQRRTLATRAA